MLTRKEIQGELVLEILFRNYFVSSLCHDNKSNKAKNNAQWLAKPICYAEKKDRTI